MPYSQTKLTDLSKLHFREEGHVYTVGSVVIPSVTQVIDSFTGFYAPADVLERARQRGNLVHQLTALWDFNPWPQDSERERDVQRAKLGGYIDGWNQFRKDFNFRIEECEQRVYHRKYRYAGTFDRTGYIYDEPGLCVVDIKSGEIVPEYAWQTAAYKAAANDGRTGNKVVRRFVVQVTEDGKYKCVEHKDPADLNAFLGALAVMNWRLKYGRAGR